MIKSKFVDLKGMKFGKLTVIDEARHGITRSRDYWKCVCDCGKETTVRADHLVNGKTKSCGCLRHELSTFKTHGKSKTRLYQVWSAMKRRCDNKNDASYHNYGGRGISVCKEWHDDYPAFEHWAFENGYDDKAKTRECTLDRIDVNGNYCPENCRWVSSKIQANNTRMNRSFSFNGETHTVSEWSDITGVNSVTIHNRLEYGWDPEDVLSQHDCHKKSVRCVSNGSTYKSIREAANENGIKERALQNCLAGRCKTCGGMVWEYILN